MGPADGIRRVDDSMVEKEGNGIRELTSTKMGIRGALGQRTRDPWTRLNPADMSQSRPVLWTINTPCRRGVSWPVCHSVCRTPGLYVCLSGCRSLTPYTWAEKIKSFERINSIRETNGNFDSCNSCKRLGTSRLNELHESKFPFVSRIEFIRSKLLNFSAHVYGVVVQRVPTSLPDNLVLHRTTLGKRK